MTGASWSRLYCGPAPTPDELWLRWNLDPALLLALAALAIALRGSRAGVLGVAVLTLAFVSPLCALSAALFSARVVHHVLLVAVAAPLLALALPARRPPPAASAFVASVAVLWAWHWPAAYDLALANVAVYWAMQLSLIGSAMLFWRAALAPARAGSALLLVLAGYMQMALLGMLLVFAPEPLYAAHAAAPLMWGVAPLVDQQLGGLIMWVPAGAPFLAWGAFVARREWRALGRASA